MKLLAGGFTGGEPHLFRQSDVVPADGTDEVTIEMNTLEACGGNYCRCTMANWDNPHADGRNIQDYPFTGGPTNYNLTSGGLNTQFFDRLDAMLTKAETRDIVVSIELWENHYLNAAAWGTNTRSVWNPDNTTTYTTTTSGLPSGAVDAHSAFYALNKQALVDAQTIFVDEVCRIAALHNNVIIQIENESPASALGFPGWDDYWAEHVKTNYPTIPVTTMRDNWDLTTADAQHAMLNVPYDYGDNSQGSYVASTLDEKYAAMISFHGSINKPANSVKIYSKGDGSDGDHDKAVDCFCQNIMCGNAGVAFHPGSVDATDTDDGLGLSPRAQRAISGARWLDDLVTLSAMTSVPLGDGRWLNRNANKAFAMSGTTDVIFSFSSVDGSWFHFDFTTISTEDVSVTWYDLDVSGAAPYNEILSQNSGERVEMRPPGNSSNQWLVHVESA